MISTGWKIIITMVATLCNAALTAHADTADTADAKSNDTTALETIVVTAQKRQERLTDVPVAISVVSGEELQRRQITAVDELGSLVPDVKVSSAYANAAPNITLRGIGPANQYNFNTNAPVGLYMDEVYQSFEAAPGVQFFDLQRIEVLKGPQGTLYGRNTTGGLVNFISKTPSLTDGYNGNLSVGYGDRHTLDVEGAADLQLIPEQLAVRVAMFHSQGDGYIKNVGTSGPETFGSDDTWQGRVTTVYAPTENFDATLRLYWNESNGSGTGFLGTGVLPGNVNVEGYNRTALGRYDTATDYPDTLSDTRSADAGLTLHWKFDPFRITSITSVESSKGLLSDDCDGTPNNLCAISTNLIATQFSEDLRLQYTDDKQNVTAGVFYGRDRLDFRANVGFFDTYFLQPQYKQIRDSYAVYLDDAYAFTDQWQLTVGVRQTFDTEILKDAQTLALSSMFGMPVAMTIPPSATYVPALVLPTIEEKPSQTTGRIVLQYKITPDVLSYLSAAHGYREGAFNGEAFFTPAELNYIGPEKVNNFEAGLKASFLGNRVTLTNALFYTPVDNQQVLTTVGVYAGGALVGSSPRLAGLDGHSFGYEFEGEAALNSALTARLSFTLLRTRYNDGQMLNFVDVGGNRFANAPQAAFQAGLDWRVWQFPRGRIIFSPDISYSSQYFLDPENGKSLSDLSLVKDGQPGFALVNAHLTYDADRWSVSIWGKNLLDRYYYIYNGNAEASDFSDGLLPGPPISFGARATVKF